MIEYDATKRITATSDIKGFLDQITEAFRKIAHVAINLKNNINQKDANKLGKIQGRLLANLDGMKNILNSLETDVAWVDFINKSEVTNGKYFNSVLNFLTKGKSLKKEIASDKSIEFIPTSDASEKIEIVLRYDDCGEITVSNFRNTLNEAINNGKKGIKEYDAYTTVIDQQFEELEKQIEELENANKKLIFKIPEETLKKTSEKIGSTSESWKYKNILSRPNVKNITEAMHKNIENNLERLKGIVSDPNVEMDEKAIEDCIDFILHGGKDEEGAEKNEYTFEYTENGEKKSTKFSNISEVEIKKGKTKEGEIKKYTSTIENIDKELNSANKKTNLLKKGLKAGGEILVIAVAVIVGTWLCNKCLVGKNINPDEKNLLSDGAISDRNALIAQIYKMEDESEKYYTQQYGQKAKEVVDAMVSGADYASVENEGARILNNSLYNEAGTIDQGVYSIKDKEFVDYQEEDIENIEKLVQQTLTGSEETFADGRALIEEIIQKVENAIENNIKLKYEGSSLLGMNLANFKNASYPDCKAEDIEISFKTEEIKNQKGEVEIQYIMEGNVTYKNKVDMVSSLNSVGYVATFKTQITESDIKNFAQKASENSNYQTLDKSEEIYSFVNEMLGHSSNNESYGRISIDNGSIIKEVQISEKDLQIAAQKKEAGSKEIKVRIIDKNGLITEKTMCFDNAGQKVGIQSVKEDVLNSILIAYDKIETDIEKD